MKFCPKCNSFCITDSKKKHTVCIKCGHIVELENPPKITNKKLVDGKIIVVNENLKSLIPLPRSKHKCPKCGNKEAFVSIAASRSEDDYEEELYRCTACAHKWRETT